MVCDRMPIDIEVRGLKEAQAKATQVLRDLYGGALVGAMRKATLIVLRDAKINAPVDTGRLRASITPDVRREGDNEIVGVVGSNVSYAAYQELGTKHMKGRFYLQRALETNADQVERIIGGAVAEIVNK